MQEQGRLFKRRLLRPEACPKPPRFEEIDLRGSSSVERVAEASQSLLVAETGFKVSFCGSLRLETKPLTSPSLSNFEAFRSFLIHFASRLRL